MNRRRSANHVLRTQTHMIMQDKNPLQIADLILKWIDERVSRRNGEKK